MAAPKRFSNGVTNVGLNKTMSNLIIPDPTSCVVYMNDFFKFDPGEWVVTRSEAQLTASDIEATGSARSYEQITDAANGVLAVVTSIKDDDYAFFQYGGADYDSDTDYPRETFAFESDKRMWFKARLKCDDVDAADFYVGVFENDTSPVASAPSTGFYFLSSDGSSAMKFYFNSSSTTLLSDTTLGTTADNTYFTVGFYSDGGGNAYAYFNDNLSASGTGLTFPTTELALSFGVQNGSAAASTLSIDYLCMIKER